jgi:5-methyltetrahydrofolate--homocysteine methyltransferase
VIDLGVDVPPRVFAERAVEAKPDLVGLSGLITASFEMMKETVTELRKAAQLQKLSFPIIIGGGMIDNQICQYVGADYWMPDAMAGVRLCEELLRKN